MDIWNIRGGKSLHGSVRVQGAKNAVLPIMAAAILAEGETELTNCPGLSDVSAAMEILRHLGCAADMEGDRIRIDSSPMTRSHIPHELMLKMRSSVFFLGPILGRCGEATLSMPGGCDLGPRPIGVHIAALRALGADIREENGNIICRVDNLRGGMINLEMPSVGATENAMLAACCARGESVITNAAREPEIADLQAYLLAMGASVDGAGTPVITVGGFGKKRPVRHDIMPDRIAASTLLCAAAAAGGDVRLTHVCPEHILTVLQPLASMGCDIIAGAEEIRIRSSGALSAGRPVVTRPYPGFATDAQPLLMAAALRARGTMAFVENIFQNRYRQVCELRRLGADISVEGRVAMVTGVEALSGAPVYATDLRGGAALALAGLQAGGETVLYDEGHIRRGYEDLAGELSALGADITITHR